MHVRIPIQNGHISRSSFVVNGKLHGLQNAMCKQIAITIWSYSSKELEHPFGRGIPQFRPASAPKIICLWLHESDMVSKTCKFGKISTNRAWFAIPSYSLKEPEQNATRQPKTLPVQLLPHTQPETQHNTNANQQHGQLTCVKGGGGAPHKFQNAIAG